MILPKSLRASIEGALEERIERVTAVGGGCINHGARIDTGRGKSWFLKWNERAPDGLFEAEADGLRALSAAVAAVEPDDRLRVPEPIARGEAYGGPSWLLLEHVESGPARRGFAARLGRGLAAIHGSVEAKEEERAAGPAPFGWPRDNWIGSLPQGNAEAGSWAELWRERRIVPQLERARQRGHLRHDALDRLVEAIPAALADVERRALLHGDLWSGNAFADAEGMPVLIDPAVYVGDGEVDLAMTELFGGFGEAFYDAYEERRGISAEYRAFRRDLYQLYYLLVHVNLFGGSYVGGARRAAERVVAEVG